LSLLFRFGRKNYKKKIERAKLKKKKIRSKILILFF